MAKVKALGDILAEAAKKRKASKIFDNYKFEDLEEQQIIDNENLYKKKRNSAYEALQALRGTVGNTYAEEEKISQEPGIYDNPLHKFATYNTIFTLSGITESELRNLSYLTDTPHDIIARTGGIGDPNVSSSASSRNLLNIMIEDARRGKRNVNIDATKFDESVHFLSQGRDIFFENVNILSTTGPNPERGLANFQKMEFELHEPFNITLVEKIRAACYLNGYFDYQDAPLLLTIEWKGFDEHGKPMKDDRLDRKIPIRIVRVEFDVDAGGAKYQCVAVAAESLAFDDRFKFPRRSINVAAQTWNDWKTDIEKQLDDQMQEEIDEGVREKADRYKFEIHPDVEKHAKEMGLTGSVFATKKSGLFGKANTQKQPGVKLAGVEAQIDSQHSLVQLFEDSIRAGMGYSKIIEGFWYEWGRILMDKHKIALPTRFDQKKNANAIKKYLLGSEFRKHIGDETNQWIDWFTIKPKVETNAGDIDHITKMETKRITYVAVPTKIHVLKFIKPGITFGNIDWSKLVRKQYNYLYTGENIDVQNLRIFYKSAYYMRNVRLKDADQKGAGKYNEFEKDLKENLRHVFGDEVGSELATLRQYASVNRSKPLVKTHIDDKKTYKKSQEFYDYLTNPQADMMRIELEILGDPAYVCQDLLTNLPINNEPKFKGAWSTKYNSFNAESHQPLIMLNYRLPQDFNDKKGIYEFSMPNRSMFFNGIYQVTKVESSIAQGSFTQTLHCVRLNNQKGEGKEARMLSDKEIEIFDLKKDKKDKIDIKRKKVIDGIIDQTGNLIKDVIS